MKFIISVFWLILILLITPFNQYGYAQSSYTNEQNKSKFSSEQLKKMTMEIKYYDEVLTASVLNYAFSGDEKWFVRYTKYELKLGQLIDELLAMSSEENKEQITYLNAINRSLVAFERRAIQSIKANDQQTAISIIYSPQFHQSKTEFMSVLTGLIANIKKRAGSKNTEDSLLKLTPREKNWIANNKIVVGIEHWPPIIFMQDNNTPSGLSGEILAQIIEGSGLQTEYIVGTWNELLTQFKQGKIDLLPSTYFAENRKKYGYFSTPYFIVRELIYVKENNTRFQSSLDLSKATIAIPAGFNSIQKIKNLYVDMIIVETTGIEDSINKVLTGEVDALLSPQIIVDNWIEQHNLRGLRVIDEDVIFPPSLHLYSHKNKKNTTCHFTERSKFN